MEKTPQHKPSIVDELVKAGLIQQHHHLTEDDQKRINSLTNNEFEMLKSVRLKLGDEMLKKTAKGGQFPHTDSLSF
jgi:hypothetical protein